MQPIPSTAEVLSTIEQAAENLGVKTQSLLRLSDVSASTWTQWKKGKTTPKLETVRSIYKTVERLKKESNQALEFNNDSFERLPTIVG